MSYSYHFENDKVAADRARAGTVPANGGPRTERQKIENTLEILKEQRMAAYRNYLSAEAEYWRVTRAYYDAESVLERMERT